MTLDPSWPSIGWKVRPPPLRVELSSTSRQHLHLRFHSFSSSQPISSLQSISPYICILRDDIDILLNHAPRSHHSPITLRQEVLYTNQLPLQWQTRRSRRVITVGHLHQLDREISLETFDASATMTPPYCCQCASCRNRVRPRGCRDCLVI